MKNIRSTFSYLLGMLILSVGFISCTDDDLDSASLLDRERVIIEDHLAENGITDYEVTPSGIYYYTLREGSARELPNGAVASLGYEGRIPYGYIFDSSYLRDDTLKVQQGTGRISSGYTQENCDTINVEQNILLCDECPTLDGSVIAGWTEAMQYMKVDDKKRFYIPSYLGYGIQGSGNVIPGNAVLMFDIELFDYEAIPANCSAQ